MKKVSEEFRLKWQAERGAADKLYWEERAKASRDFWKEQGRLNSEHHERMLAMLTSGRGGGGFGWWDAALLAGLLGGLAAMISLGIFTVLW